MSEIARKAEIHVFNYPTHAVEVWILHAPVGDIVQGWAEPTADGGEMMRTWTFHHTLDGAFKSAVESATIQQQLGDKVNVIHHDCT